MQTNPGETNGFATPKEEKANLTAAAVAARPARCYHGRWPRKAGASGAQTVETTRRAT